MGVSSTHGTSGCAEAQASVETATTPSARHVQPRARDTTPQAMSSSSMRSVMP